MNKRVDMGRSRQIAGVRASVCRNRHVGRRLQRLAVGVAAISVLAGCYGSAVDPPTGPAPLRYRDQVFTNFTATNDLQYGSAPDLNNQPEALKLDLYQPVGDTATQRPAVVWVHGGGFCCGDKSGGPAASLAQTFVKRGYVTVSINYRLLAPQGCSGGSGVTSTCYNAALGAVHDGQAAVRWLRANAGTYRIDPNRIGIGGESAGAIVATGVGVLAAQPGDSGNPGFSSAVQGWVSISGGLPGGMLVSSTDAPGYLFSGTADPIVPYQWSLDTANAMDKAGVPVVLRTLDGAGHVPWSQYSSLFDTQSANFFYKFLNDAAAQQ